MNLQISTTEAECPRAKVAAYVDGELLPREELELEIHLTNCPNCSAALNEQKKILLALDFAMENEAEIELPANFTKIIVAKAESGVSGLRSASERLKAFYVCLALSALVVVGLGAELESVFSAFVMFGEKFLTVGGSLLRFIYDVSIGAAVILRSFGSQFVGNQVLTAAILAAVLIAAVVAFSRKFIRFNRL